MLDGLERALACPDDGAPLHLEGGKLWCRHGHGFAVAGGIPVLFPAGQPVSGFMALRALDPAERALDLAQDDGKTPPATEVHPEVRDMQGATGGTMFHAARHRFATYPIPEIRLPAAVGEAKLLDLGCGWGRWSIAAARKGYRVIGVDQNFQRLVLARRACRQVGVAADFVCCDARRLPFPDGQFDTVFSYSVVQHFSKPEAYRILSESGRVLKPGGSALVQMAHRIGIRSLYHQLRLALRAPQPNDVRYWSGREMSDAFDTLIGPSRLSIDGFFGLGLQAANAASFLPHHRLIVQLSEVLRRFPALRVMADSLYVHATKRRDIANQGPCS